MHSILAISINSRSIKAMLPRSGPSRLPWVLTDTIHSYRLTHTSNNSNLNHSLNSLSSPNTLRFQTMAMAVQLVPNSHQRYGAHQLAFH